VERTGEVQNVFRTENQHFLLIMETDMRLEEKELLTTI
jgi:hypothetical protein